MTGMNKQQQPDSSINNTSAHCPRVPSSNLGLAVPEKNVMKKCLMLENWRERKMKKGTKKSSSMIPVYMIHPPIVHNKFQPSRPHSS